MGRSNFKEAWISKSTLKEKPWGYEQTFDSPAVATAKCLVVRAGYRTSLKYYDIKSEVLFLKNGLAKVEYGCERYMVDPQVYPLKDSVLSPGECLHVPSGCPYRITALEDCEIYEIGSGSSSIKFVRLEDDYQRNTSTN